MYAKSSNPETKEMDYYVPEFLPREKTIKTFNMRFTADDIDNLNVIREFINSPNYAVAIRSALINYSKYARSQSRTQKNKR